MTKRDLVSAALKVFGVILIVQTAIGSVLYIESIITAAQGRFSPKESAGSLIAAWVCCIVVALLIGILLVRDGDRVARLVIGEDAPLPSVDLTRDARPMLGIALTVFGVFLTVTAVTGFVHDVAQAIVQKASLAAETGETLATYKDFIMRDILGARSVEAIVKVVFGLVLAIWGNAVAGVLWRGGAGDT